MLGVRPLPLFRLGRLEVALDSSLILALAYLGWSLVDRYATLSRATDLLPFQMAAPPFAWVVMVAVGALISLVLHELAHLAAARLAGGRTRRLTLSLVGSPPRIEAPGRLAAVEWRAALAGPAMSAAVGLALGAASGAVGLRRADLHLALYDLAHLNLVYAAAQLIPAAPFDGGRVLRALLDGRLGVVDATSLCSTLGKALAAACVGAAVATGAVPLLFVAVFLFAGATANADDEAIAARLDGLIVRDAAVGAWRPASVHDLLGDVALAMARVGVDAVPVLATDGAPLAALSAAELRAVPARRRWVTRVGDVLPRLGGVVDARTPLAEARRAMLQRRVRALVVVEDGRLSGVLTADAIERRAALADLVSGERALWGIAAPPRESEIPAPP